MKAFAPPVVDVTAYRLSFTARTQSAGDSVALHLLNV
jgi:hypothetical protein